MLLRPALFLIACAAATSAFAQHDPSPALDEGAGRSARLVTGAKREGSLSLYASMAEKDLIRLVSEFERRYGIKVKVWRSGKNNVLRRAVTEGRAARFEVDVVHNPSPEMELLHREGLLQEVRSPYGRELIPEAVAPHREWAGPRVYIFVQAYNTSRVAPEVLSGRTCSSISGDNSTAAGRESARLASTDSPSSPTAPAKARTYERA